MLEVCCSASPLAELTDALCPFAGGQECDAVVEWIAFLGVFCFLKCFVLPAFFQKEPYEESLGIPLARDFLLEIICLEARRNGLLRTSEFFQHTGAFEGKGIYLALVCFGLGFLKENHGFTAPSELP